MMMSLFFVCGCSEKKEETPPYEPLKPLEPLSKNDRHVLKVGYVELVGYPVLSERERRSYEENVEAATKKFLGYEVDLIESWVQPAPAFYGNFKKELKHPAIQEFLSWDIFDGETQRMKTVAKRLTEKHGEERVKEYLHSAIEGSHPLAHALLNQAQELFSAFSKERSQLGKPILDLEKPEYHSYWILNGIQQFVKDVDLIVVNQLICIPDDWMPLYTMARGGVTTGAVEDSHHRPLGGTAFMSLYPFLGKDAIFSKMNPIPEGRGIEVAAAYTTHELGHLLARRVEIYDHEGCVSKAATGLNYWEWYEGVLGAVCQQDHPVSKSF